MAATGLTVLISYTGQLHSTSSDGRRTSSVQPAYNPLQFISVKPAVSLAKKASHQIELVQETKKKRESVDRSDADWQDVGYLLIG